MKPVSMCWAMSVMIAVCVTPGFRSLMRSGTMSPPVLLAQDDGNLAVPGSADAPGTNGPDDYNDQTGQAMNNGQTPDDPGMQPPGVQPGEGAAEQPPDEGAAAQRPDDDDANQQDPPSNVQQSPADDDGDDAAAEQKQDDNADQGDAQAPAAGDDQNDQN